MEPEGAEAVEEGLCFTHEDGVGRRLKREWGIQRRQSARTVRLMPAKSVGRWPAWFAGLLAGDRQVQAAGHFEVEDDVGDVDAELGDVPFKASQVVNQCVEV